MASISVLWLLTLMFIGPKLAGYITWSWIWVLSPIGILVTLGAIFAFIEGGRT